MKRIFLLLLVLIPFISWGQLDEDYEYNKEFIWGINKNTNAGRIGGLVFRWSRIRSKDVYRSFGFELINVRHPKEYRYQSLTGATFNFGKTNYLYAIRLQYGRDIILFRKDTQQGVQINAGFMGGPTIGLRAPYYIQDTNGDYVRFDPDIHRNEFAIAGPGKLFQGLAQSESILGINAKGSVSFEFGSYKNNVAGIEAGIMVEAFTREVVLVPTQDNRSVFPSIFFTLYWGKRK